MTFGDYMAQLREARRLSQAQVAARANTRGVLQHTVSRWERGAGLPDVEQLAAWLTALDATDDERLAAVDRRRRVPHVPPGSASDEADADLLRALAK